MSTWAGDGLFHTYVGKGLAVGTQSMQTYILCIYPRRPRFPSIPPCVDQFTEQTAVFKADPASSAGISGIAKDFFAFSSPHPTPSSTPTATPGDTLIWHPNTRRSCFVFRFQASTSRASSSARIHTLHFFSELQTLNFSASPS